MIILGLAFQNLKGSTTYNLNLKASKKLSLSDPRILNHTAMLESFLEGLKEKLIDVTNLDGPVILVVNPATNCFFGSKLLNFLHRSSNLAKTSHHSRNRRSEEHNLKQVWRVKSVHTKCNVVLTSLKSSTKGDWYFDTGSSRHMIGE